MSADMQLDVCATCAAEVYLNVKQGRSVKEWAHKLTGGKFCDLSERSVAVPRGGK